MTKLRCTTYELNGVTTSRLDPIPMANAFAVWLSARYPGITIRQEDV